MATNEEDLSAFASRPRETPEEEDFSAFASRPVEEPAEEDALSAFASRSPEVSGEAIDFSAFASVEGTDDRVDDDRDITIGEFLRQYLNTIKGVDPRSPEAQTLGELMEIVPGLSFADIQEGIVSGGQFLQEGFRSNPNDARGVLLAQAFDVAGQTLSGTIELFAGGAPDEANSITYNVARTIREATRTPEDVETGFVEDYFVRPLLQTATFLVGGRAAQKLLNETPRVGGAIAAWLGAGVGSQAGREDAVRHGATEEQMEIAFYANAAFGATEGLPIGILLSRIDDASGGFLSRRVKTEAGKIVAGGIEGLIVEALQETGQTLGENWTAKDLAGYDPERNYGDNLLAAAGTGGSIGYLLGMVTTAIGGRSRTRLDAEIKRKILVPLGANSLDEIAGPVSIIQDHLERLESSPENLAFIAALQAGGEVDPALHEAFKREKVAMKGRFPGVPGLADGSSLLNVDVNTRTTPDVVELALANGAHNKDWVAAVIMTTPTAEIHGEVSLPVIELVETNSVVMAISREQTESIIRLRETEKLIEEAEAKEKAGNILPIEKGLLEEVRLTRIGILAARKASVDAAKDIKTWLDSVISLLGKGSTLVVDDTVLDKIGAKATNGQYASLFLQRNNILVNSISLDTSPLSAAATMHATSPTEFTTKILEREKAALLSTTIHEFGHAIAFNQLNKIYKKTLDGTATEEETQLFNAIRNDYFKFIRDSLNAPMHEAQAAVRSLIRFARDFSSTVPSEGKTSIEEVSNYFDSLKSKETIDFKASSKTIDYLFGFQEYLAEQTAKIGLEQSRFVNPDTLPFFRDVWKSTNKILQSAKTVFKSRAPTLEAFYLSHGIRQQIKTLSKIVGERSKQDPLKAIFNDGLLTKEQADRLLGEGDTFNWFMDKGFNILQIAEQNPHLQGVQNYVQHLREWKNEVNTNLAVAEDRLAAWKNLGKVENEKLARLLFDETIGRLPDGGWLADPRKFTDKEIATYNLSDEGLLLRIDIKKDFSNSLKEMEKVLIAAKKRIFAHDVFQQTREINKVKKEFSDMRGRPYFPLMRFGDFVLQVRSNGSQVIDGKTYADGQLVDYQTFDTKGDRNKALGIARKQYTRQTATISASHRVIPNFSLQGMPLTMLEHLENRLTSTSHSEEVSAAIKKAMTELKNDALPFKSFRKQFQRRKRIEGFSLDAQRAYANYMTSFSNHIARVKFDSLFKEDFDNLQNSINAINRRERGDSTKRAQILNHMNDHLNYVMNPVNEFVALRSATFLWFLGFNVKSAFVNLTQIPLVTYPYLAARYGDGKAVAEITRAYGTAVASMTKKDIGDPELYNMIERGLSESWLDESLATELALAASEKNLEKTLPRKFRQKALMKLSYYGSLPFHVAEKFNRHITAIASYRLARTKGLSHEGSIFEARRAVEKTQFEYARWARPRFMRGKLGGTVFVFQNYMQNALYFALGGDPGAFRMIIMLFMMSGIMGLPFAENIGDLIDAAMTTLKRRTGMKEPLVQVRVEMRKMLNDLDVNADLIMHGMSSSTFGLANLGEFMGWPIPDLDLSGSLSMGRILPGTQLLKPGFPRTVESTVKGAIEFGSGAVGSAGLGILSSTLNDHPDTWKAWEKAMPAALRQISKAARLAQRGGEETRSGYPIAGFDMHDPKDQGELIGQALGFTPRELSKGWEGFIAQQQAVIYYKTWRTGLLRQWNYAKETRDTEAVKEINKEIREYNSIVPFPEMKVGVETRIQSFDAYVRTRQFSAKKIERSKPFQRLSSSIEAVFEEENNEGT